MIIHYDVPVEPVRWLLITAGLLYIVVLLAPLTRIPELLKQRKDSHHE